MKKEKLVLKSEIVTALRNAAPEAVRVLMQIAKDKNATVTARVNAAQTIVDYAINSDYDMSFQELAFLSEEPVEEAEVPDESTESKKSR